MTRPTHPERDELLQELASLRGRLAEAQYLAGMGDFSWDMKAERVDWSDGLYHLLGYDPAELIDQAMVNQVIHHPEDFQRVTDWMNEGFATHRDRLPSIEHRMIRKTGETIYVQVDAKVEYDEVGQPVRIFGTCLDITERRKAAEALQSSECRYRLLTESTLDIIWTLDLDFRFTYVNPAVLETVGREPSEMIGTPLADWVDEKNLALIKTTAAEALASDNPDAAVLFESAVKHKDGTLIPVEIHGKVVRDEAGHPTGFQGISRDISKRLHAEQEGEALREQLVQAQKMEAVGRLAGGIAHDFNNILLVIGNYVDLMLASLSADHPLHRDLTEVRAASHRASDLTRQLLAFSRKQLIRPVVIDINENIGRLETMLRRLIGEDIDLAFMLDEDLHPVVFDPGQVEQILFNLVVNSRDAMPEGGKLTIETRNVVLDGDYCAKHRYVEPGEFVLLAVSDTGQGMDDETVANVFEPFFTTKPAGEGTGLGMSTVYGITKQHGGAIEIYTEVDLGTTVKIYMPRAAAERVAEAESATEIAAEVENGEAADRSGHESILLVEDDENVREIAERILTNLGYEVHTAAGPEAALRLAETIPADLSLVVTDVVMPTMNGKVCYEKLLVLRPGLKVLYMSGYTKNAIAHRGVLDDGIDFLQKPFQVDELARAVRTVLDRD